LIDVPYLSLTPGTRSGIVHDERYSAFIEALAPLEACVNGLIDEQRRAEEEQANTESLRAIQRAFREAMLALPREESSPGTLWTPWMPCARVSFGTAVKG